MSTKSVCIICNEGASATRKLVNNPSMLQELLNCCKERVALGQSDLKALGDHLESLSETDRASVLYHSECRKHIVNKSKIERLRMSASDSARPGCSRRGPGRPSSEVDSRPKRTKTFTTEECMFTSCKFCSGDGSEALHRVFSDNMGHTFLKIKMDTQDDLVRTSLSDLFQVGDAAALEKHYHRNCLQYAKRTCNRTNDGELTVIRSLCDEEFINIVQNTLVSDDVSISISELNDEYLSVLERYQIPMRGTANYRKHLKNLIMERLPNLHFIKPVRQNEPERLVCQTTLSKAIEYQSSIVDSGELIGNLKNIADTLREEMLQHRGWTFKDSFEDFENPPLLQFFIGRLLSGKHVLRMSKGRNQEIHKTTDVACQFLIQNTQSDRQVKYQAKKSAFQQTTQTPLSMGLPLAIHSRVRDKNLVRNLSDLYIGCDYQKILDFEKRLEQAVLQRVDSTGGFCLPDFVKKGVNIWFAVDNIDLLEDTPTGQNTFHGTIVVINQRAEDGVPLNDPLVLPEKLQPLAPHSLDISYLKEPVIKKKPICFHDYQIGKRKLNRGEFTETWALASYFTSKNSSDKANATCPAEVADSTMNKEEMQPCGQQDLAGDHNEDDLEITDQPMTEEQPMTSIQPESHSGNLTGANHDDVTKGDAMPTWAATKSLLMSQSSSSHKLTNTEVIAPLYKTSPTDYGTLYTVLALTQGISNVVVGPERKTIITLDLDLYNRAIQIQQSVGNSNWVLCAGVLHIVFACLHSLGKTVDGSGIDTCAVESGIYTSAALRGIFSGKAYKRGIEYHITTSLAIFMMKFDVMFASIPHGELPQKCSELKTALHERNPEMTELFEEIQSFHSEACAHYDAKDHGELAQFLTQYLEQVECLLSLISACRSSNWEGYLAALEGFIKYFFAHDLLNYARLMPVYLAQMNALEKEDPVTWEALKSGDFVVAKSEVPFTCLFTDQTLEQEIKGLKRHGGMVGLSQDEAALDRLVTTTPHLARIVRQFLNYFTPVSERGKRNEHYQLTGNIAARTRSNALKLRESMELHCTGNPFETQTPLKSLASSALIPEEAKGDILHFAEKGQMRFEAFVQDRLLPTSKLSVWDPMQKLKLRTFSNWMQKTKVRLGDKVVKLREERELLGRFLIIQGSRPDLVPKLEETIGEFEMSVVPRSVCAVDGSLYIPGDKASLMHAIEGAKGTPADSTSSAMTGQSSRVLIIDAMAVLQGMKKTPTMLKISDFQAAFIERIKSLATGYSELRVIFDNYLDQSLKNKTRQKRAVTSTEYVIHPEMKLTMSLKDILSSTKSKRSITKMFAEALLEKWSRSVNLVVAYGNKIKSPDCEEEHTHEEADTLIPHQVMVSVDESKCQEIGVWSPDTDVLTLLLHLVACGRLGSHPQTRLKFLTGKGNKYREIDVVERARVFGHRKCQGLIGLHNFSGTDWGGKFVGITKKKWVNAYLQLPDDDDVIDCFMDIGESCLPTELNGTELPEQLKPLERFVCQVYSPTGPKTLPALRWEMFRSRNLEGEMLPPTRAVLLPHITRANYTAMRDKSYHTRCPKLPPIEQNGWNLEKGEYVPVRCLTLPAPRSVLELTKCNCRSGCRGRCSCSKNGLPCTPLCKCYGGDCSNAIKDRAHNVDDDDYNE